MGTDILERFEDVSFEAGHVDRKGLEGNVGSIGRDEHILENAMVHGQRDFMPTDEVERNTKQEDEFSTDEDTRNGYLESGNALSDVQRATRRAEEAANRRFEAAKWLQKMVGALGISSEPSEEEMMLCLRNGLVLCILINKVHPGAVPKIVENPPPSSPADRALSAYQYFENVRNFLVALDDLGLPSFEASDLEQGSCVAGSMAKVVDCILALKSFCEWRDSGALGIWKYIGGITKPGVKASPKGYQGFSNGKLHDPSLTHKNSYQPRKRWVLPSLDSSMAAEIETSDEFAGDTGSLETSNPVSQTQVESRPNGTVDAMMDTQDFALNTSATDSTANWIHHIGQKFREVLQVKAKRTQDVLASENSKNGASQSLPSLVKSILGDKDPGEIPVLVEFMLRKVMEEFEHRLFVQNEQIYKLKHAFQELLMQKERQISREKLLETLAAGSTEELKIVMNQLQLVKMEKKQLEEESRKKEEHSEQLIKDREDKIVKLEVLCNEVEILKHGDHEHKLHLELQRELELESRKRISEMESLLAESQIKMQELQMSSFLELENVRRKELMCQNQLKQQLQAYQSLRRISYSVREEVLNMQTGWQGEIETLQVELEALSAAASGYHKVLAENRELYNEVQDLKGNIRVYCRVRPSLVDQKGREGTVDYIGDNGDITIVNPSKQGKDARKSFNFNKVFGSSASQEEVFRDTQPLIRSVLDGFNVCIFAYGQTGSGKTYTMSGPNICSEESWGVNYRALNDLFQISQNRKDVFRYEVGVQMIEIYNEQVRDLLVSDGAHKRLEIRNNSQQNGLNVPDASLLPVKSTADVLELMKIGQKNRAIGATALNERSSRSHSVLTVHVQGMDLATGSILRGCLHLVDLAGSERVDKSEAMGDRLREAQHINKSLSALGDVIAALAHKSPHVPYRNSKLTQLLQDSLGGQAKTLMFVHVNSDVDSYGETISTLKFAERVASVELGAARSNKESGESRELKEQVTVLKDVLVKKDAEIVKRDAEISKRDAEIARLQDLKNVVVNVQEANISMEKPKVKNQSLLLYSPRLSSETQGQKLRKMVPDGVLNVEARPVSRSSGNRIPRRALPSVPSPRDSFSDDADKNSEGAGPAGTSPNSKTFEEDSGILRQSVRSFPQDCEHSAVWSSMQVNASKQKGGQHSLNDQEASLKDWKDRIQSSTESLLTSASLDEEFKYWDAGDPFKISAESTKEQLVGSSPTVLVDVLNRANVLQHPNDFNGGKSERRRPFYSSNSYMPDRHVENEAQSLQGAEFEDKFSELSEGAVSQEIEIDGSFATIHEHTLSQRSYKVPSGKSNVVERRSSHLSQIPRPPSRSDRRANKVSGESTLDWPKNATSHRQPLLVQSGLQSKSTKRWH
ncbi:hypothetical protein O6H91_08G051300 [Diphasiastrum complanatum]|uniref:Uncharacterized protein n=1 Tax=Diphasiastrum complanatum TaxID=34168 RepID=A0ACC2CXP1_DIPCM|nr:hypothetical protein O6H91_08G051300 [Diphasiastrum complanatum]